LVADHQNYSAYRPGQRAGKAEALFRQPDIQIALQLCDLKGEFLFRVRPDLFPLAMLTELECDLWGMYFEQRKNK
tara:strand:- start:995 stop:1219 length:225 start_codon:yes stop_codon:yes gene_type:complete